jgi:hypothetical protein
MTVVTQDVYRRTEQNIAVSANKILGHDCCMMTDHDEVNDHFIDTGTRS